jgi:putative DNA primase/helicase
MPHESGVRFVTFDPRVNQVAALRCAPVPPAVEILSGATIEPEPVRWLWPGWLARGKVHFLAGSPGTGKTTIALSLAAAITSGGRWPDGTDVERGRALIWSGEDDIADTILPRLIAAGADRSRCHFLTGIAEEGKHRPFDPATDMEIVKEAAKRWSDLRLVILDPVATVVRGDSHKNTETRRGLQPLVDLAAELDCAVLGITHLSKGTSGREPLERVTGSVAFGAVARIVLMTVRSADADAPRRLIRAKSNLGLDVGGFEYSLISVRVDGHNFFNQRVDWGEALEGTARELMQVEDPDTTGGARDDAAEFLRQQLRDGPVAVKDLPKAAEAHGHAWGTVKRAKKEIGIIARKATGNGLASGWLWELPLPAKGITGRDEDAHLS